MTTYLITGGTGFIGANLARTLIEQHPHATIHLIIQPGSSLWRLADISHKFFIHEVDLINFINVTALIHRIKPSYIFHLAAFGGMPHEQNQAMIFRVNLDASMNLLNACKQVGFACFINTGSSSEYGKKNTSMHEHDLLEPLTDYGIAKAATTQFCYKEAITNQLPIYTIRPFSVYGPYEAGTRLIPTVLSNALMNQPINLASPSSVRDFIHVEDMINLYLAVADKKPKDHFVFNAGTGVQSTIQEVVEVVQKIALRKLTINWGTQQPRPWEPRPWIADTSLSHTILGWQPHHSLQAGLTKTMEWFEKNVALYQEGSTYEHRLQQTAP